LLNSPINFSGTNIAIKRYIYKMILIKAPKGYGASKYPSFEPEKFYKTHRDHEGTIEATIINDDGDYITHNKFWYIQEDGSYEYKTKKGSIKILSNDHFEYEIPDGEIKDIFIRITSRLKKVIKDIDSSKKISDFEIETGSGIFIYFDTKVEDNFVKDKFINISFNGDVSTGKIYRGVKQVEKSGIDYIVCYNKGSGDGMPFHMYYSRSEDLKQIIASRLIKKNCDPLKVNYSTYMHYKNKKYYFGGGLILILLILFLFLRYQKNKELLEHNKKNKTKFKTYSELSIYKQKLADIESKKEEKKRALEEKKEEEKRLKEEKKLKAEEKRREKLERASTVNNETSSDLGASLKRLKRMYNDGNLNKTEFEKAKNKLLK